VRLAAQVKTTIPTAAVPCKHLCEPPVTSSGAGPSDRRRCRHRQRL